MCGNLSVFLRLISETSKLRCTCQNGALTHVNVSAPLSSRSGGQKQTTLCWKIVLSLIYFGCRPDFSCFPPYKRMKNGRLLVPTCWKPVQKRSDAFRAPRKCRTSRVRRAGGQPRPLREDTSWPRTCGSCTESINFWEYNRHQGLFV